MARHQGGYRDGWFIYTAKLLEEKGSGKEIHPNVFKTATGQHLPTSKNAASPSKRRPNSEIIPVRLALVPKRRVTNENIEHDTPLTAVRRNYDLNRVAQRHQRNQDPMGGSIVSDAEHEVAGSLVHRSLSTSSHRPPYFRQSGVSLMEPHGSQRGGRVPDLAASVRFGGSPSRWFI